MEDSSTLPIRPSGAFLVPRRPPDIKIALVFLTLINVHVVCRLSHARTSTERVNICKSIVMIERKVVLHRVHRISNNTGGSGVEGWQHYFSWL